MPGNACPFRLRSTPAEPEPLICTIMEDFEFSCVDCVFFDDTQFCDYCEKNVTCSRFCNK